MGGYGTWNFATEHPERLATIAPISGAAPLGCISFPQPRPVALLQASASSSTAPLLAITFV